MQDYQHYMKIQEAKQWERKTWKYPIPREVCINDNALLNTNIKVVSRITIFDYV